MSLLRLLTTGKSLAGVKDSERRYRLTSQRLLPHFGSPNNPFTGGGKPNPAPRVAQPSGGPEDGAREASIQGSIDSSTEGKRTPVPSFGVRTRSVTRSRSESQDPQTCLEGTLSPLEGEREGLREPSAKLRSVERMPRIHSPSGFLNLAGTRAIASPGSQEARDGEKSASSSLRRCAERDLAASPQGGSGVAGRGLALKAVARLGRWIGSLRERIGGVRRLRLNPAIPRSAKPPVQGELSLDRIKVVRNDLSDADLEVVAAKRPVLAPALPADRSGLLGSRRGKEATRLSGIRKA
jgi:hypothetical protein